MSTGHLIQTIFEVVVIAAIIVGYFYQPILAKWERKQGEKMLRALKKQKGYRK